MKKIGFIDYYIDEWHANNYPEMIRQSSFGSACEVALAYAELDAPGKRSLAQWCGEQKIVTASSIEQVIEECDWLVVLSPDNVERHEELSDLPLRSGKPVYVDKPFAPDLETALRMFDKAEQHGTPLMSSSALRFGSALENVLLEELAGKPVSFVSTQGGGTFATYAIHQLEMLVMVLGTGASRVMQCGNGSAGVMLIDYPDCRRGVMNQMPAFPFRLAAVYGEGESASIDTMDDFFPRFIESMLGFFDTGMSAVPKSQTLEIAALLEAGTAALRRPDEWIAVPQATSVVEGSPHIG